MKISYCLLVVSLLIPSLAQSAVQIISRNQSNQQTSIYLQGNKARIETVQHDGFMVLDLVQKSLKLVLHKHQAILDLSDIFSSKPPVYNNEGEFIDSYIEPKKLGPKIAGYETEEYEIFSNGQKCGSAFVSVRAIQETGFRKFFKVLDRLAAHVQNKMSMQAFMPKQSSCDMASSRVADQLLNIGFPLRLTDHSKMISNEVIHINTRAQLPANAFLIPPDYKLTTAAELRKKVRNKLNEQSPDMIEMMKNLPPEARELMIRQLQRLQP